MNKRELKFRAWDTYTNQMIVEGFYPFGETMTFGLIESWLDEHPKSNTPSILRTNDVVIMQYTGLKDVKGKEIYEGDIVKYDHEDGVVIAKIVFKDHDDESMNIAGFAYEYIRTEEGKEDETCDLTVIGNIYENPNLISCHA